MDIGVEGMGGDAGVGAVWQAAKVSSRNIVNTRSRATAVSIEGTPLWYQDKGTCYGYLVRFRSEPVYELLLKPTIFQLLKKSVHKKSKPLSVALRGFPHDWLGAVPLSGGALRRAWLPLLPLPRWQ